MVIGHLNAFAQEAPDTNLLLPVIEVKGKNDLGFENGLKIEKIDSITLKILSSGSLSDLLERSTVMYTKNYGAGNMSTLSFRGASSAQSGVYWNDFNINPPGAGMIDLSLIPLFLFNKLQIQYGGAAASDGSGVMGGALYLGNSSLTGAPCETLAGVQMGSFGEYQQYAAINICQSSWGTSTAFIHKQLKNNYGYRAFDKKLIRENAAIEMYSFMQNYEKYWHRFYFNIGLWAQNTHREIPGSITGNDLNASRVDQSLKFTARLKKSTQNGLWKTGFAFFYDYLRYKEVPGDTLVLLDSRIKNSSALADVSYETEIPGFKTHIYSGLFFANQRIDINDFGGKQQQSQFRAGFRLVQPLFRNRWRMSASLFKEGISGYYIPLTPSFSLEGNLVKHLNARLYLSLNHRVPSMNDRYWKPGGNENLLPESGRHTGGGIIWTLYQTENIHFQVSGDLFYADITDCISWVPSNLGYFIAQNFQKVEITGAEVTANLKISFGNKVIILQTSVSQVNAINKKRLNSYDLSQGKQLIYTPKQKISGSIFFKWNSLLLTYDQSYTGQTFTNRENTEIVKSYAIANLTTGYNFFTTRKLTIEANLNIENIWDVDYEVVKYYPMPGRAIMIGLIGKFKQKKDN